MGDVNERLDRIEQTLVTTNEGIAEIHTRLDRHDERFDQIDGRFDQIDGRFTQIDDRFRKVDERFDAMDTRVHSLASDVQKLRVLAEMNSDHIKTIAEVQSRHGEVLHKLEKIVEPLEALPDFLTRVVDDHERRITALEKREP